jgi:TonB family protein
MDESRQSERKAFRRRSLVAFALSIAFHGAFFALLFSVPLKPSGAAGSLTVSIQSGEGGGSSLAHAPVSPQAAPLTRSGLGERDEAAPSETPVEEREPDPVAANDAQEGVSGDEKTTPALGADRYGSESSDASSAGLSSSDGRASKADRGVPVEGGVEGAAGRGNPKGDGRYAGGSIIGYGGTGASGENPVAVLASRVLAAVEARKVYPEAARRRGTEGTVRLKFSVAEDGRLLSAKLDASSGSTLLDRAALDLFASVFPVDNAARREVDDLVLSVRYGLQRY